MKTATIRVRDASDALGSVRTRFLSAWKSGKEVGEFFDFESPYALFRVLTPKRWELIQCLQRSGPLGVRALARALERDVKRVHEDVSALVNIGLVARTEANKLHVPFKEIRADFVMKAAA